MSVALALLVMAASSLACYGQGPVGGSVSGLGNSVFIIFQAKNNDYWFGADGEGAYRYDGKVVTHFAAKEGLTDGRIREIQEDKLGNIYFSTQGAGVFRFDGKKFEKLTAVKGEWKLEPDDLWFKGETGTKGPYRYDGKTLFSLEFPKHYMEEEWYANSPGRPWSPYEVYKIYKDRQGSIWLGTSNFGLARFDGETVRWMYEQQQNAVEGGGWFGLRSILEDKEGAFWICNTKYRYRIEPGDPADMTDEEKAKSLLRYKREAGIEGLKPSAGNDRTFFMSALVDKEGDMWMATYAEGVYRYDGKKVTHYPVMDGEKVITVFAMYQDKQGDLWLGTHEHGALKFNGKTFERFLVGKGK